jgi:hypothetical protein
MSADEGAFIELVVAAQRVDRWMQILRDEQTPPSRCATYQTVSQWLEGAHWNIISGHRARPKAITQACTCSLKQALLELTKAVQEREPYAEEVGDRCRCAFITCISCPAVCFDKVNECPTNTCTGKNSVHSCRTDQLDKAT